jgi:hypothetical protein
VLLGLSIFASAWSKGISSGLIHTQGKSCAVIQLEPPKNVPTLQTFLGMMTYFASYIPFYTWIVHLLFALLKKDKAWKWTYLEQEAFKLTKQALVSSPVMTYPVFGKPYRLYTDACDYGISTVLQQVQGIQVADLKDTKNYDILKKVWENKQAVPKLVASLVKDRDDVIGGETWDWENTTVQVE